MGQKSGITKHCVFIREGLLRTNSEVNRKIEEKEFVDESNLTAFLFCTTEDNRKTHREKLTKKKLVMDENI